MIGCMCRYPGGLFVTPEEYAKLRKAVEPPFKTDDITEVHKRSIRISDNNATYFCCWNIGEIRKCCGISDKNMALFLNEAEYYTWWDAWEHHGIGVYNKYHFYKGYITNAGNCVQEHDPFYDAAMSNQKNDYSNQITFGGFTKKEILNDYFIREGKGYHLLDMVKKFYGSNGYKQQYDQIMNFAKNQMVFLEEDISEEDKEIRQKKLEGLATETLDAIQKLADKIREK